MMKKVLVLAVLVCSVTACEKNIQLHNSSIVGKWKLSEYLADPGDGSGTWQPADPSHPGYLEFNVDGTLTISPYNIYNSDHYQVTSDSTMIFLRGSESFPMGYHFSETLLTLHPSCIEACGERFIPVKE
jgi:hypothetical protein